MRRIAYLAAMVMLCLLASSPVEAGDYLTGWGVRAGATIDPDQFHVGMHLDLGEIADHLRLQPNVEAGFGDNFTVIAFNPELLYLFKLKTRWTPYAGGGLGINVYNRDNDRPMDNDSETGVGLNLIGGIETRTTAISRFFIELKAGMGDAPGAKVTFGVTFLK